MNTLSLALCGGLCLAAVKLQEDTRQWIKRVVLVRQEIMASRDRCPEILSIDGCDFVVRARSYGDWQVCSKAEPPSGADLPMHRWFKVTGRCQLTVLDQKIFYPVPSQVVYR